MLVIPALQCKRRISVEQSVHSLAPCFLRFAAFVIVVMSLLHRLNSFVYWSSEFIQSCAALANAGFHYSGQRDTVVCAFCTIEIEGWSDLSLNPREEHRARSPNCPFISSITLTSTGPCDLHSHVRRSRKRRHRLPVCVGGVRTPRVHLPEAWRRQTAAPTSDTKVTSGRSKLGLGVSV
jgi:Inhibitor of Apoptosis domain